jgi:O-antigen ligase
MAQRAAVSPDLWIRHPLPIADMSLMQQYPWQSSASGPTSAQRLGGKALTVLLLMLLLGIAPLYSVFKTGPSNGDGDVLRQLIFIGIFLSIAFTSGVLSDVRRALVLPLSLTLALAYCALSLSWAIYPSIGARRLILTFILIWSIFKAVELAGYEMALKKIRLVLIITLVLNYLMILTPYGVHQAGDARAAELIGNWKGVFTQKNYAGAVCAFTILFFTFDPAGTRRKLRLLVIAATAYFLYRTVSKTSMGLLVLCTGVGYALTYYNVRYRVFVLPVFLTALATVAAIIALNWERVSDMFGEDDALTGRGHIWPAVLSYFRDHWIFGSGYGSFWNAGDRNPLEGYLKATDWILEIGNAHNGFFDLMAQIGLPGFLLAIVTVFGVPFFKMMTDMRMPRQARALLMSCLVFAFGHNFTETSLLDRDAIVEVFLMLTIAMSVQACRVYRPAPRAARRIDMLLSREDVP